MKNSKKYSAIIALIILAAIDAIIIILTKKGEYDPQFWVGFAFIQASFLAYIISKLFIKDTTEERGIRPLDTVLFLIIAVMIIMGLIAFLAPYKNGIFKTLIVFYIIITALGSVVAVLACLNKKVIENATIVKPRIFNQNNLVEVLEETKRFINDDELKGQVQSIIDKINGLNFDITSLKGKQLVEYSQFMYKNATRQEVDNLYNNINKVNEILNELM